MPEDKIFEMVDELSEKKNYAKIEAFLLDTIKRHFPHSRLLDENLPLENKENAMIGLKVEIDPESKDFFEIILKPDHDLRDRELRLIILFRGKIFQDVIDMDDHFTSSHKLFRKEAQTAEDLVNYHLNQIMHLRKAA